MNERIGRVFAWVIVILVSITVYEVIMRRFLQSPTIWSFEISKQLYAFHFMILAAYGLLHGSHVSVDILYNLLSARTRNILDIISHLIFFFPFSIILLWKGYEYAQRSWAMREMTEGYFAFPLYYIKSIMPITAILLLIQGVAIFINSCYRALGGEDLND